MDALKRKRSRLACKPCRERKRKCDGKEPCVTCTDWGYECYYEAPRKRQSAAPTSNVPNSEQQSIANGTAVLATTPTTTTPAATRSPEEADHVRRLEANSGAAFVRKLALKMDASKAPNLNLFGWNIGARDVPALSIASPLPVVDITSLEHMKSLAHVYFDKVDRCYGFIDQVQFFARLDLRYTPSSSTLTTTKSDIYDSILAGVAALGCLFSQRNATITEVHLVRSARASLEAFHLSGPPPIELLLAYTLRVVYLRITDSPHETWIASSNLMHLVEASGLYPESPSVLLPSSQAYFDPDLQRRIVGVAHHLNAWTSFDLGVSRVAYTGVALPPLPSPKPGDYTVEVLGLLPVSVSMDPSHRSHNETPDLLSTLSDVLHSTHTQNPSVMAQCNVVLCILRRIATHAQGLQDLSASPLASSVLSVLDRGLYCARDMIRLWTPWHQVVNVPFHTLCVLLVLDTRASLAMLPNAMQTLSLINSTIDSETTREAYRAAGLLLMLHQQRRKEDLAIYSQALGTHQEQTHQNLTAETMMIPNVDSMSTGNDWSWMEALVQDIPSLQGMDIEQFLSADLDAM